jgi:hypothetical protein
MAVTVPNIENAIREIRVALSISLVFKIALSVMSVETIINAEIF